MAVAYRILLVQSGLVLLLAALSVLLFGASISLSILMGGLCCILPNLVFAWRMFAHQGARAASQIVKSFYRGEMLKVALTIFLFLFSIVLVGVSFLPFMVSYGLCQMIFWLAPWLSNSSKEKVKIA